MMEKIDKKTVEKFIDEQLKAWPMAAANFDALNRVDVKEIDVDGMCVKVQFNPARAVSSGAKVDAASIKARKCFLCKENRPAEQHEIDWNDYYILINPFPIFPRHLTIPLKGHSDQIIENRVDRMFNLAEALNGYTVFYNGPKCGASAPDHMHFQAGNSDFLPLNEIIENTKLSPLERIGESTLYGAGSLPLKMFVIDAINASQGTRLFDVLYRNLPINEGETEPMMNVLCYFNGKKLRMVVIPRKKHRPSFYGTEGEGKMMISPASVDLAGVLITPRREDFDRMDAEIVRRIYDEVGLSEKEFNEIAEKIRLYMKSEPIVKVGILHAPTINFELNGIYLVKENEVTGIQTVAQTPDGRFVWKGEEFDKLEFKAKSPDCTFELKDVVIGVNFHWERKENQKFKGNLEFLMENGLWAVNSVPVEDYLASVISSEMSAKASLELLKAHAVISRSWLLAQIEKQNKERPVFIENEVERVRWYDREDHVKFHVCADDHCQRYQGITRQTTELVQKAVNETYGVVLTDSDGKLCDARFSKSCGGVFEEFETCWEPIHYNYLEALRDTANEHDFPDLKVEENATKWILSRPDSFCNTEDPEILAQVLNDYDQETHDFYRWSVHYTREEISKLAKERSGIDFGEIQDFEPIQRGTSGRLLKLKIIGSKRTMTIGKELEIRRTLSPSHLYSSAFVVEKDADGFTLRGAGWGHGVGLCQIGAAVMGAKGYQYDAILAHYYPNSSLTKIYK